MTDHRPIDPPPAAPRARGTRTGVFLAIIALAFVAGAVLTGYLMRHVPWLSGITHTNTKTAQPEPTGFNPAQPLNATGESANPALDPNALASREATLAGQLTALEARTAAVTSDAGMAAAQAGRAEGLLVAFAARRALDRGVGLGYLEEQLRTPLRCGAAARGRLCHRRRAPAGDAGGPAAGAGGDRTRHPDGEQRRLADQPAPRDRRAGRAAPGGDALAPAPPTGWRARAGCSTAARSKRRRPRSRACPAPATRAIGCRRRTAT
ncbi:MAG: hypothetical protein PGN08_15745 [Sphingomonas taxi]